MMDSDRGGGELRIPPHYEAEKVGQVWRVEYEARAREATRWRQEHRITPSASDEFRVGLLLVDVQNTFCIPGFELFVGGRSGSGAVDDNQRLCTFIYRNLARISTVVPTLDTHRALQIFHSLFLTDEAGSAPEPYTLIEADDVATGRWSINAAAAGTLDRAPDNLQQYLRYYAATLETRGRYALSVWPYHAMLGGIGHALVPAVEEAIFFHTVARLSQAEHHLKGDDPWTENYSALGPEVDQDPQGRLVGRRNEALVSRLAEFDALIVAGQAKSHCVAWTVADLLAHLADTGSGGADRVYLLEDCTSPVIVPGAVDYTEAADRAFGAFEEAGAHRVDSGTPMNAWPGPLGRQAS